MVDSLRSRLFAGLLVLPVVQEPPKSAAGEVPASLFPTEMLVYAQVRSMDALETLARSVGGAVGEGLSLEEFLAGPLDARCDLAALDRTRSIAVGWCMFDVGSGTESIGFVPVGDEARFLETYVRPPLAAEPVLRDGYAALPRFERYTPGGDPPRAGSGLLPGDIAVRVDLEALIDAYRPTIDLALEGMRGAFADPALRDAIRSSGGMDAQAMFDSYADAIETIVDSAELFDVALALEGDLLRAEGAYTAVAGSELADWGAPPRPAEMADLASLLDPGAQFSLLASIDIDRALARIRPWLDALMQAYPEPMRSSMRRLFEMSADLAPVYGREMALSGQLFEGGMRTRAYWRPSDPAAVVANYGQFLDPELMRGMAITLVGPNQLEIDGISVTQWQWSYDVEQLARASAGGGRTAKRSSRARAGCSSRCSGPARSRSRSPPRAPTPWSCSAATRRTCATRSHGRASRRARGRVRCPPSSERLPRPPA